MYFVCCINLLKRTIVFFQQLITILDPSEIHRPDKPEFADKDVNQFRDYSITENDAIKERVFQTYKAMHRNQTVDFVKGIEFDSEQTLNRNIMFTKPNNAQSAYSKND